MAEKKQTTMVHQYIRNKRGVPKGMLVAMVIPGSNTVRIGWSMCHLKKDKFDKQRAVDLAIGRMKRDSVVPQSIKRLIVDFYDRWTKFFKDRDFKSSLNVKYDHYQVDEEHFESRIDSVVLVQEN